MDAAIEREEARRNPQDVDDVEDGNETLAPAAKTKTEPSTPLRTAEGGSGGVGLSRAYSGSTLVPGNFGSPFSPDLTPTVSEEDSSDIPSPPLHRQRVVSSSGIAGQRSSSSTVLGAHALPPSPLSSEHAPAPQPNRLGSNSDISRGTMKMLQEPNVDEAVAEAMRKLSIVNNQQRPERAMKLPRQNPSHAPNDALKRCFQKQIDEELKAKSLNTREWLRMGTWWLMKVSDTTPAPRLTY